MRGPKAVAFDQEEYVLAADEAAEPGGRSADIGVPIGVVTSATLEDVVETDPDIALRNVYNDDVLATTGYKQVGRRRRKQRPRRALP